MKIKEFYKNEPVISLEIFPPKPEMPIDTIFDTIDALSDLKPAFMSVTYGAAAAAKLILLELQISSRINIKLKPLHTLPV